jgi:hypothetical protein
MKRVLIMLGVAAILSSCASFPPAASDERVIELITRLSGATGEQGLELSSVPFLFDREILKRESDVSYLFENLRLEGFRFGEVVIRRNDSAYEGARALFADTMDVRVFFDRRLPEDARAVIAETDAGLFYFLVGDRTGRLPRLYGMKGPE